MFSDMSGRLVRSGSSCGFDIIFSSFIVVLEHLRVTGGWVLMGVKITGCE